VLHLLHCAPSAVAGVDAGVAVDDGASGYGTALAFGIAAGTDADSYHGQVAMAAIPWVACANAC